jgi:cytochrome c oxidase subunit 1
MLWAIGFLITFTFGGLTGVILASPPLDFHVSDTYFVVAHFHYVVFGTVVFAMFSGFYFWWPKWTGKMLNETLGKWHFWLLFIGFHTTFLIQHWIGVVGMPRRYWSYLPTDNVTWMNQISTVGAASSAVSMLPFFCNVYITARGAEVTVDDPWGYGARSSGRPLPAAAAQLHVHPAHPLGGAGVRPQPPRSRHPVGIGPAKDAPEAPVYDAATKEVK